MNKRGITAFVLKYRVVRTLSDNPLKELMPFAGKYDAFDKNIAPVLKLQLSDGLTAVTYVRSHARDFDVNPDRIGFMGFSAGGTITMSVAYNATAASRPNFVAPVYAYGRAILDKKVPKVKTPIFIVVASNDENGFAPHSIQIYSKWLAAKQPESYTFIKKEVMDLAKQNLPTYTWLDRFVDWLKQNGLMPSHESN